ncbi:M48 family metalloprotease [Leptothermofonsia sp. ETS-13]|uniref:M48 family metalloprotease n=1 Tax=Leptothermofonsia sp. ETS-13 TaxID=3035696 RepID=UPI003B9E13A3
MSSPSGLLQAGLNALKQKHYLEAVQAFETFCKNHSHNRSKEFFQAQMYLVKAYQESGQPAKAIALCQEMAACEYRQVREWAQRTLPTLSTAINGASVPAATEAAPATEPARPEPVLPTPSPHDLLPSERSVELLNAGNKALKMRRFADAVDNLEKYCQGTDPADSNYAQAQMWLVKAYKGNEQTEQAIALCRQLLESDKEYVRIWAKQFLLTMVPIESATEQSEEPPASGAPAAGSATKSPSFAKNARGNAQSSGTQAAAANIPKAGRSDRRGVKLPMKGGAASLSMASGVTLSLLFGMILVLCLSLLLIMDSENPTLGLVITICITILVNAAIFFISPIIMDFIQGVLYGTRWISLSEVERYSPETGKVIREVCQQKKIKQPRLGIIEDQNPTAFTYGSLPNSARLVVSRGLFTYLDDDEIATVYAHELGHIVHWDFAVMTLASTLVQIAYLLYAYINKIADQVDNDQFKNSARGVTLIAYVFYVVGEYLLLYLSRTREYYADHFAAEVTGNPNGLSRALVKIAYGILEEGKRSKKPSTVLQGTRALGIADPKSAAFTGTAYRVASEPQKIGRVFLWDMFNPWAWWMELSSTHPLTGKRVRALSTYAEQLGLDTEFDMGTIMREGRSLNKHKLYGSFAIDVFVLWADKVGALLGLLIGTAFAVVNRNPAIIVSPMLIGFGFGTLLKMFFMYPDFNRVPETDVLTLMSDPYASPLRGRAVKLAGEVIGRGDAGYKFGSDLKMQDPTGMIYLRYTSRFGLLGNFLFGMGQANSFINREVTVVGWFRRGIMPWVDMVKMDCPSKWTVTSHPRFWMLVLGSASIILGFFLPSLLAG